MLTFQSGTLPRSPIWAKCLGQQRSLMLTSRNGRLLKSLACLEVSFLFFIIWIIEDILICDLTPSLSACFISTAFYFSLVFNSDLSKWDTSKVEQMTGTFQEARNFNRDISKWNTAEGTTMSHSTGSLLSRNFFLFLFFLFFRQIRSENSLIFLPLFYFYPFFSQKCS